MWDQFVNALAWVLTQIHTGVASVGIPYSYGWAIIIFTVLIKLVTLPLTNQQYKSMRAQQALQPKLAELQKKYAKDREKLAAAQMELYKEHGVNPLGGCLPLLVQLPVLYALFATLRQDQFVKQIAGQGFYFVPNLACPGTPSCPANYGQGIEWLWPLPPRIGWETALPYLVLALLVVISQVVLQKITTSMTPQTSDNPQAGMMNQMMLLFSVMFGYYSLIFPSSLSLYYVISNLLTLAQQYLMLKPGTLALAGAGSSGSTSVVKAEPATSAAGASHNSSATSEQSGSANGSQAGSNVAKARKPKRYKRK